MSGAGYGRIGPYELRGLLGRGGMAAVYRAYSPSHRREVALKVLTAPESKLDVLRERFRREARAIGRLSHPNILALLDTGEENGIPYLVTELIEGGTLTGRLGQPLPPGEAVAIARQIGGALDYAHGKKIVHRDVKPANIFLQGDRAILADFGIAKVFDELGPRLTQTGVGIGTPEYTSPEQAVGDPVDARSDLYALGVVLYEMLTGKPPYQGATLDVVSAHVQGSLPDPRSRNPALPPAVGAVLTRALARRPADRYGRGADLAAALQDAITGTRDLPPVRPPAEAPGRTMFLNRTRELLLRTKAIPTPQMPPGDATIVAPRPAPPSAGAPQPDGGVPPAERGGRPRSPAPAAPPALPALPALPEVPRRAVPPPPAPEGIPSTPAARPTPAPPRALPLPPLPPRPTGGGADEPTTPRILGGEGQLSAAFAPPTGPLTPLAAPPGPPTPPAGPSAPPGAAFAPSVGPQAPFAPPGPPPPTYTPPPPVVGRSPSPLAAPPRRGNRGLVIGLAIALVLLIALVAAGGATIAGRRVATPTPTVRAQASAAPSAAPASAAAPATPVAGTPSPAGGAVPPRVATATAAAAADPARAQIAAGDAAVAAGQFPQAVAAYKEALAINPNSAIANRQLGLALWIWNEEAGEIGYLDKATTLDRDDPLAWAYLSFSAVDTHQVERAYAAAQRAVAANSEQAEAWAALANCYVRYPPVPSDPTSGRREAREAIERAKGLDANNLWVLWAEQVVLAAEENDEGSLVPLDKMIAQRPRWATLYSAKGVTYRAMQRPAEARTFLAQALAIDPEYPWALTELGWLAYDDGDFPGAQAQFQRALRLTDDVNDSAHIGMGYALAAQKNYTDAILHCQRAAMIESRQPGGFSCLGYLYRATKQYDESLAAYRKVLELRPYLEDGHVGIALIQADQGKYVEAEATLKQGLTQISKPRWAYYWLGWVLYQQNKYQEAQPNLEQAAQVLNDAGVQFLLGQNLERLQRFPEARAAYEKALAIDPNYADAKAALERLRQQGR